MRNQQHPKTMNEECVSTNDLPSWEDFIDIPNLYEDCFTTDPNRVLDSWDKLSQSTLFEQLAAFPACVYFGLKKTYDQHFEDKQ